VVASYHALFQFFIILLFRSGYEILMSHPKLYWNDDGKPGDEWLRVSDEKRSTEFDKEVINGVIEYEEEYSLVTCAGP
jgi:sulfoxide reductase catalytic subunit YedY